MKHTKYLHIYGFLIIGFCLIGLVCLPLLPLRAEITVRGLEDHPELSEYIDKSVIQAAKNTKEDEGSASLKAADMRQRLKKALEAKGYYDAQISYTLGSEDPRNISFSVRPGKAYTISDITISNYAGTENINLKTGDTLDAIRVLKSQADLQDFIAAKRCIYNLSVSHRIILDHENHNAQLFYDVRGESHAKFGETSFEGADKIEREYLYKFITYEEGECWNPSKVEETRTSLIQTGLIASVDMDLPKELPASKIIPMHFILKERAPRKVRLGMFYSTYEGPGVSAEWKHLNFFGEGEELSIHSRISTLIHDIGFDFTKPFFLSDKQNLNISSSLRDEDTEAFTGTTLEAMTSIDRKLSDYWTGELGVGLELSEIEEDDDTDTFGLISLPAGLTFDNRDDPLDPHSGHLLNLKIKPFFDTLGQADPFYKSQITGTAYFDMSDSVYDPVLALRASFGSIWGAATENIPASKRFFAGGGGSIRGYGFQEAGPYEDGDPAGGRSLIETNTELRVKFTETIGAVAFVDAGGVYDDVYPSFNEDLYIGGGLGARYYSSFGPIRFDVAMPFTNKEKLDQNYQIYISIGQAF